MEATRKVTDDAELKLFQFTFAPAHRSRTDTYTTHGATGPWPPIPLDMRGLLQCCPISALWNTELLIELSGSDHSLKGATPISRRTESVTYREFVSSGLVLTRSAFIVTKAN